MVFNHMIQSDIMKMTIIISILRIIWRIMISISNNGMNVLKNLERNFVILRIIIMVIIEIESFS